MVGSGHRAIILRKDLLRKTEAKGYSSLVGNERIAS